MSTVERARWWTMRPAQNRKPATYRCPLCGEYLPALSEHVLIAPEGDATRRRHAHTACVLAARRSGGLPTQDEWRRAQSAASKREGLIGREYEAAETNGLAIASLVLGIIWLFGIGSVLAIVLGYRGMRQVRESHGRQSGWAIALAGVVIGIVGLASLGVLIAFLASSAHHEPMVLTPGQ